MKAPLEFGDPFPEKGALVPSGSVDSGAARGYDRGNSPGRRL
jgi:hypothetical protein